MRATYKIFNVDLDASHYLYIADLQALWLRRKFANFRDIVMYMALVCLQRSVSQRQQLTSMLEQLNREENDFLKLLHRTLVNTLISYC